MASSGWHYKIAYTDLPRVSALALGPNNQLYVSLEKRHGTGEVLRIEPNGSRVTILADLDKPDGMTAYNGGVAITQEDQTRSVIWWHDGIASELLEARGAEGLASDGAFLYVVEDQPGSGRLLRYDSRTDELVTLRRGLDEAEGVAACANGEIYYTEKESSQVRLVGIDDNDPVVVNHLNKPGFLLCRPEGLWITEDATHGSRLLLLDQRSQLHVILRHLRTPQSLLAIGGGHYLLAEQGRNRILEVWQTPEAANNHAQ